MKSAARIIAVAYLAAILAGSLFVGLLAIAITGQVGGIGYLILAIPGMAVFSLPGLLLLRLAQHLINADGLLAFALAGACNGLALGLYLYWSNRQGWDYNTAAFLLACALCGAVSGLAYRMVERTGIPATGCRAWE